VTTQQGLVTFHVETKRSLLPKEAEQMLSGFTRKFGQLNRNCEAILVVAPWLSARTREILVADGLNYVDLTGNARIEVPSPALFLSHQGAGRDPQPTPRGKARGTGPKAGRLIRFLVDVSPPYTVSAIASATRLAPGYVSRLLESLDDEALIERGRRGQVTSADMSAILRRWTETYDIFKTNLTSLFVAPNGAADLLRRIGTSPHDERIAITGSFAAVRLAPVAAPAMLVAYVHEIEATAESFGLLPADIGANAVLLSPFDDVVWERTSVDAGITYASPSQVAMDCLTGNGRMPSEGEALVTWMIENEPTWRAPGCSD
jgi:hypothetical protein